MEPTNLALHTQSIQKLVSSIEPIYSPLALKISTLFKKCDQNISSDNLVGGFFPIFLEGCEEIKNDEKSFQKIYTSFPSKIETIQKQVNLSIQKANEELKKESQQIVTSIQKLDADLASQFTQFFAQHIPTIPPHELFLLPNENPHLFTYHKKCKKNVQVIKAAWNEFCENLNVDQVKAVSIHKKKWFPNQYLSEQSPIFLSAITNAKSTGSQKLELLELNKYSKKESTQFIQCLQRKSIEGIVDEHNVKSFLKLAVEYKIDWLLQSCQEWLSNAKGEEKLIYALGIGCELKLPNLLRMCFERIKKDLKKDSYNENSYSYDKHTKDHVLFLNKFAEIHGLIDLAMILKFEQKFSFYYQNGLTFGIIRDTDIYWKLKELKEFLFRQKKPYDAKKGTQIWYDMWSYATVSHKILEAKLDWYQPKITVRIPFDAITFWEFSKFLTKEHFNSWLKKETPDSLTFQVHANEPQGTAAIAAALEEHKDQTYLQIPTFEKNYSSDSKLIFKSTLLFFLEALKINTTIRSVKIPVNLYLQNKEQEKNEPTNEKIFQSLRETFTQNKSIEELTIFENEINQWNHEECNSVIRVVLNSFEKNSSVKKLTIPFFPIKKLEDEDRAKELLEVLAEMLNKNTLLEDLTLVWHSYPTRSWVRTIADALATNKTLRKLSLTTEGPLEEESYIRFIDLMTKKDNFYVELKQV